MRIIGWALMLLAMLFNSGEAFAQAPGIKIFVHADLEAESNEPAPGETITLALTMRLMIERSWVTAGFKLVSLFSL